ncbi:MAG: pyridoxal phosphate-dependent aminotransferase [Paludibacteraceae bacterium]|nr:pyridoxal phosphate-dependent aminotransferase [Paludibacteraceae bacterium]MBR5971746.1 pyridoxal phosphate-dependent aminotransferase [Paludibacteraceae bacterium]
MKNIDMLDKNVVKSVIDSLNLPDFSKATIREIVTIANKVEALTGEKYVRMEMGVPGFAPDKIGTKAEIEALQAGVASKYPMLDGHPELKKQASRFVKAFIDVDVNPEGCVPVSGSMQGTYASFLVSGQCDKKKDTVLFIDPGFPVQKTQLLVLGMKYESFDMFQYRGKELIDKVESYLQKGNICNIIYSNPNNPSWFCLTEEELKGIGELATKYDVIVMEDLAYFAMDFRKDLSQPYKAPFQPTVAKYTDNYILLISGSKAFSYAGQRIGVTAISNKIFHRFYQGLADRYTIGEFGMIFVNRILYVLSSGTSHSAQYALAAMFKAACDGEYNFLETVREYGNRAAKMKKIFIDNGFHIVYDKDIDQNIGDGFYFTVGYKDMKGGDLMYKLLFYGISAISLDTTGSKQQGLRVCTSFIKDNQYEDLQNRLAEFAKEN